jgi:hypothetical protein
MATHRRLALAARWLIRVGPLQCSGPGSAAKPPQERQD